MEEVDSISVAVSNIDINKVEPLENRRVVAFLNHFLCTTVTFLNQFAEKCENKLDQIQQKLFKIELALRILERKLESLPTPTPTTNTLHSKSATTTITAQNTFEVSTPEVASQETSSGQQSEHSESPIAQTVDNASEKSAENTDDDDKKTNKNSVREDPRYAKYFKMMYVGVPPAAIMQKMASEGVDPAILNS